MILSLLPQCAQPSICTPNTRFSLPAQLIATCNGGDGLAADMAGGPPTGEDAADYDLGIPEGLCKYVLSDQKEHCRVKAHVVYRKDWYLTPNRMGSGMMGKRPDPCANGRTWGIGA